jgi:hypothetical protein
VNFNKINPSDLAATVLGATEDSLEQAQGLFESTFGQVRHVADSITDATVASVKRNQTAAQESVHVLSGLLAGSLGGSGLPDMQETLNAGFALAKSIVETQRELAERIVGAVLHPVA